ncbi:hypothetical protein [Candidatus Amarobacter glycogenicus]|uniref:hypothetical protein n=1 Tax=Candidatus Amarobacter glycogenicus TaxID=3140699 RepID=UPI00313496AB|nr:hypothetical protein [Dehalococcoidia bacterium]
MAWGRRLAALLIIPAMAAGGGLVFDRGLPTSNLNNTAGGDRSNVAWAFGDGWITGDDFTVGAAGETWVQRVFDMVGRRL